MALKDELEKYVGKVFREPWSRRLGRKIPDVENLLLNNTGVAIDATVLYADIAGSTQLVARYKDEFATEIYKTFLYCSSKLIRSRGGSITAFDGDRVMGVFIGDNKNSEAARCALHIKSAVKYIINPKLKNQYPNIDYALNYRVGIDTSELFVARTGIRGSNDLVWAGNAANNAAKMATLPPDYNSYISAAVYRDLDNSSKYDGRVDMWTNLGTSQMGYKIYGSRYSWSI